MKNKYQSNYEAKFKVIKLILSIYFKNIRKKEKL